MPSIDTASFPSRSTSDPSGTRASASEAPAPLAQFVRTVADILAKTAPGPALLQAVRPPLASLVRHDGWLPPAYAAPDAQRYRQYLLYLDPAARFSVVSFVWGPGQQTAVHDHKVWGLVAVHKGVELSQRYRVSAEAAPEPLGTPNRLERGDVELLWPPDGDVHRVSNGLADRPSVSIHVYGADIGTVRRNSFPESGGARPFVSGYSNGAQTPPFHLRA